MAYTTINDPEKYFQAVLYTGNGSTQDITLPATSDLQPDWVWIKERTSTSGHVWVDATRGLDKVIRCNQDGAESTDDDCITAFNSDGFSIGDDVKTNESNTETYAAWCWKAGGGSGSSNTDGDINTTTTSVNTTSGVSISTWTGTGSNATVGHGLGAVPKMIITKARSDTYNWYTYHVSVGNTKNVYLDLTNAASSASANFHNNTDPTSSVWTAGGNVYNDNYTFVTYAMAEVQGFSKFGKYIGNGNANGTNVYTGFKPAFIMIKRITGAYDWYVFDNKRPGHNEVDLSIRASQTHTESTASGYPLDILSNGFKIRTSNAALGGGADPYIYMAFAESPFVNSKGIPNNAD